MSESKPVVATNGDMTIMAWTASGKPAKVPEGWTQEMPTDPAEQPQDWDNFHHPEGFWHDTWNSFLYGLTFGAFGKRYQPRTAEEIIAEAEKRFPCG